MRPLLRSFSWTLGLTTLAVGLLSCDSSPTGPVVASVQISANADEVRVGNTLQLTATPRDANGNAVQGEPVTWGSSNTQVATVSSSGLVTGVEEGQVSITAEAGQITGQIVLQAVNPPTVSSISPAVLRPGVEMTITGERFSATAQNNQVRVLGALATVLDASETSITARVADFTCGPQGLAPVVVVAGGESTDPFEHPFEPDEVLELAVGEIHLFSAPDFRCLTLAGSLTGTAYLVGIQSASTTITARTPVRIRGFRGQALPSATALSQDDFAPELQSPPTPAAGGDAVFGETPLRGSDLDPRVRRWTQHRREERRIRDAERRDVASIIRSGRHLVAATGEPPMGAGAAGQTVPSGVQEGDTIPVKVPDLNGNICQDFQTVSTVVRRVGTRSVWLEDVANPSGGLTSGDYLSLSDDFDNEIFEELASYFGEPTDLDENDRVVITITRRLNEMRAGTLGFVVTTDFFPGEGGCPSSNGGEFYYARAPDPDGTITDPDGDSRAYSRNDALSDAPLLLAHEVTHVVQFGRRLIENQLQSLEDLWIMEGQATLAEEAVGFRFTGLQSGSNLGDDVAFGSHDPRGSVEWFSNAFVDLAIFYGVAFDGDNQPFRLEDAPQACAWLDFRSPEPCISQRIGYGVTWSFLRWLSDHFAADEQDFQRRIVDSSTSGFGTLSEAIGTPVRPLLAPWAASLYTDERLPGGDPLLSFPSWDLRRIEDRLIPQARLTPEERGFTSFQRDVEVAAGSTTYQIFRTSLSQPPFALSALTLTGQELPTAMQLWVVRLQ